MFPANTQGDSRETQERASALGREQPTLDQEHKSVLTLDTPTTYNCTENQTDWGREEKGQACGGLCDGKKSWEFIQ